MKFLKMPNPQNSILTVSTDDWTDESCTNDPAGNSPAPSELNWEVMLQQDNPSFTNYRSAPENNLSSNSDVRTPSDLESSDREDLPTPVITAQPQSETIPPTQSVRSLRDWSSIKPPQRYGLFHYYEPKHYKDAVTSKERIKWVSAMDMELSALKSFDVWEDYKGPEPPNPLRTTWIYRLKENCHGDPVKFKARLCVQGFSQIEGVDYFKTFAPTSKPSSLRLLLLYALKSAQKVFQFDMKSAFLHSPIEEEVIIRTPKGSNQSAKFLK